MSDLFGSTNAAGTEEEFTAKTGKKGVPEALQWNDFVRTFYKDNDFDNFMQKVANDLPNVRKIDFTKYDSDGKYVKVTDLYAESYERGFVRVAFLCKRSLSSRNRI